MNYNTKRFFDLILFWTIFLGISYGIKILVLPVVKDFLLNCGG